MGQGQQRRRVLSREEQRLSYLFLRGEPSLACSCLGHQLFSHYERQTRVTAADGAEVQQNSEGFGPRSTALGKRTPSRVLCPWPESPRVRTTPVSMTLKQSQKPAAPHNVLESCTRSVAYL